MSRLLSSQFLFKMHKFGYDSSDDSSFEDKKKVSPKSFIITDENTPELSRKNLLTKLEVLTKFHKDNEILLSHRKIGWALIYEFFFEKLFFIEKDKKKNNIYINLHEIELHIRKEISKIKENKAKNESEFTIFNKIVYNPPISSWYANNFLSTETNKLISQKESNSYITKIIDNFSQYEKKKVGKNVKKKNSFGGRESERKKTIVKNQNNLKSKRNSVKIGKIPIQALKQKKEQTIDILTNKMNNNNNNFLDNYSKTFKNEPNEENYYNLNQTDLIPKNAKKGIENYCISKKEKNPLFVEEEINNIFNEEKCYNVELRNSNIFSNKFMDKRKFLIDFNFYQNAFNKHKIENSGFNLKSEINKMFNQIDKAIELASNFKTQNNN